MQNSTYSLPITGVNNTEDLECSTGKLHRIIARIVTYSTSFWVYKRDWDTIYDFPNKDGYYTYW